MLIANMLFFISGFLMTWGAYEFGRKNGAESQRRNIDAELIRARTQGYNFAMKQARPKRDKSGRFTR